MRAVQKLERAILGQELIMQFSPSYSPALSQKECRQREPLGLFESVPLQKTLVSHPCVGQGVIPRGAISKVDGNDQAVTVSLVMETQR